MLAIYKIVKDNVTEEFKILEVRTEGIMIFDSDGKKINELSNIDIVNCHYSDNKYLYVM
jgi:hypothetical protein